MLDELNNFYLKKEEPVKSCLLALRDIILNFEPELKEAWKYRMPCFTFKGKHFCYLWTDKESGEPYILIVKGGLIDHPNLVQGSRARMKIFPVNSSEDIPLKEIYEVFELAVELY